VTECFSVNGRFLQFNHCMAACFVVRQRCSQLCAYIEIFNDCGQQKQLWSIFLQKCHFNHCMNNNSNNANVMVMIMCDYLVLLTSALIPCLCCTSIIVLANHHHHHIFFITKLTYATYYTHKMDSKTKNNGLHQTMNLKKDIWHSVAKEW